MFLLASFHLQLPYTYLFIKSSFNFLPEALLNHPVRLCSHPDMLRDSCLRKNKLPREKSLCQSHLPSSASLDTELQLRGCGNRHRHPRVNAHMPFRNQHGDGRAGKCYFIFHRPWCFPVKNITYINCIWNMRYIHERRI